MYKTLLFDFDGTLADSFASFMEISNILAERHHFTPIPKDKVDQLRAEGARALVKRLNIPFYKLPFIARDMKKLQQEHIADIQPFPKLPEVLRQLKERGFTLGIVTSNGEENVRKFLKKNNIDIFTHIHTDSSMFGKDKVLRNFLKKNMIDTNDVLYIGDEIRDLDACKKVGIHMAAATWGFNTEEGLRKNNPTYLIQKPADLLTLLKSS